MSEMLNKFYYNAVMISTKKIVMIYLFKCHHIMALEKFGLENLCVNGEK